MSALVWFRRDLRVNDHPALSAALQAHDDIVPVFCLDDRLLHGRHASGPRTQFLLQSLADLAASLRARGSGLVVCHGPPERELVALARAVEARAVHFSADVSPFARSRGERVRAAFGAGGPELVAHPGLNAIDDVGGLKTQAGGPYTVFSPFHRAWEKAPRRDLLRAPDELPALPRSAKVGVVPALAELGLTQEVDEPPPGGESAGRACLGRFLAAAVDDYGAGRDVPARHGTSGLSPYLHLGCVSAGEVESSLGPAADPQAFRRQLCWRDFYHHVLFHFPGNATSEFQQRYRGKISWSRAHGLFAAWCDGLTGYPLVDAGMRQLRREGWMHNRVRMVVGSFLTKDLGIDWRWGERHFMRLLVDGDQASNNGNWQWIASVGTDPQPVYRRILSPTRQMATHDPDGAYVRRYVPELKRVPDAHLSEPWTMSAETQREAGCVIGVDYPAPIVNHAQARQQALERYRVV